MNWISIKDELPPVEPLHYIDGEWFEMIHEEPLSAEYEVTHWMYLPEAAKNE